MKNIKRIRIPLFIILVLILFKANGQQENRYDVIANEEYEIINQFFDGGENKKAVHLYNYTYSDKWAYRYFSKKGIKSIFSNVGIPVFITNEELEKELTPDIMSRFRHQIYQLSSIRLEKQRLTNKNIKLVKSFSLPKDRKKGVMRISKPIIVGNLAIFMKIGENEAPIYILRKENQKWEIIYTFYDWLILE